MGLSNSGGLLEGLLERESGFLERSLGTLLS